ncbi:hypothetical protein JCM10908_006350 [Rhodotorula pacifica]|uniref:uncharacterized protein n=1 Tax=Rhodotorula pacifica TaxID=1495444 RepID=UPI0031735962
MANRPSALAAPAGAVNLPAFSPIPVFSPASPQFTPPPFHQEELPPSARPPPRDKSEDYAAYRKRARNKHPKESRPVSLLRLPDELVLCIFQLVYADYDKDIALPPMAPLRISKRISELIRPLWFRKVVVPEDSDLFMAWLLRYQAVHRYVQQLELEIGFETLHMYCLVASQLHNLKSLTFDFNNYFAVVDEDTIPSALIKLLSELPLLRRLDLGSASIDEDFALFLLSDKAPRLDHITCYGEALENDILGALELRSLELRSMPDNVVVPWLDLERLSLISRHFSKETYEKLLKSIKDETDRGEKPLKLRRLYLDLQYKDSSTGLQLSLDTFYDHLLWTLRKSPLYTLDITLQEPFSTLFKGYTLPSVRGLNLTVGCSLRDKEYLSILGSFISLFPNLTHLKLSRVKISTVLTFRHSHYHEADSAKRALHYPHLTALLVFLQDFTRIVDFQLAVPPVSGKQVGKKDTSEISSRLGALKGLHALKAHAAQRGEQHLLIRSSITHLADFGLANMGLLSALLAALGTGSDGIDLSTVTTPEGEDPPANAEQKDAAADSVEEDVPAIEEDVPEQKEQEILPPLPPATLIDMPDEVLLRIFHYVRHLDPARTARGTPPLRYLYINKRVYLATRPTWYEHLNLAFDKQGNGRTLMEKLLWAVDVHPYVKSAMVTLSNSELAQEAVAISVLSRLQRLEVSIEPASWVNGVFTAPPNHDEVLSAVASRFPYLQEFRFGTYTITDDGFLRRFEQHALPPRFRLFEARLYDNRLVSRAFPKTPKFEIFTILPGSNPPQVGLHLQVLTRLKIKTSLPSAWTTWLAASLEANVQNGQRLPLRFLELQAMIYDNTVKAYCTSTEFTEKLLRLLRNSELRHLRLRFGILPWKAFAPFTLEYLTSMTLDFECNVLETLFVEVVSGLVHGAPNLVLLSVDAPDLVCASLEEARAKTRLSEWDFSRRHSAIHDVVLLAQDTRILDLRAWKVRAADAWVRWTRPKPEEPFECEVWYFYPALE